MQAIGQLEGYDWLTKVKLYESSCLLYVPCIKWSIQDLICNSYNSRLHN